MNPFETGFEGQFKTRPSTFVKLYGGSTVPSECPNLDFRKNLMWWTPPDVEPKLLWCNEDDEWFELTFNPIPKP